MKLTVSSALSFLFITLLSVLIVLTMNVYTVINKANEYHQTCIAEIQASNFSSAVIDNYVNSEDNPFEVEIINRTVLNDDTNLEKVGRIYEVKTTYIIHIPIINYDITKTIQGFAR